MISTEDAGLDVLTAQNPDLSVDVHLLSSRNAASYHLNLSFNDKFFVRLAQLRWLSDEFLVCLLFLTIELYLLKRDSILCRHDMWEWGFFGVPEYLLR